MFGERFYFIRFFLPIPQNAFSLYLFKIFRSETRWVLCCGFLMSMAVVVVVVFCIFGFEWFSWHCLFWMQSAFMVLVGQIEFCIIYTSHFNSIFIIFALFIPRLHFIHRIISMGNSTILLYTACYVVYHWVATSFCLRYQLRCKILHFSWFLCPLIPTFIRFSECLMIFWRWNLFLASLFQCHLL